MVTERFRYQLRQESLQWQAEALISADQYQQLSDRYQFQTLDQRAQNRFTGILIGLGGILLGLAVITFVAANWQAWAKEFRVLMLFSALWGINSLGFWLWRQQRQDWQQRLGVGLLLLGALLLGATMALMAQMFHIGGSAASLFLAWGLGVTVMAYSLGLVPLGVLAFLLLGWGYWDGYEFWRATELSWSSILIQGMPLFAALLLIPLAYRCNSRVLFTLGAIAVTSALYRTADLFSGNQVLQNMSPLFTLAIALLWAYSDQPWEFLLCRSTALPWHSFQPIARALGILNLGAWFYGLSFHDGWKNLVLWTSPRASIPPSLGLVHAVIGLLTGLAVLEWGYWLYRARRDPQRSRFNLTTLVIASGVAIAALTCSWHVNLAMLPVIGPLIFNILLFLLAGGLIRESITTGERNTFWFGMILLILQVLSRFLEYDTDLLLKSFAFAFCGIGAILSGLWFERYLRTHASLSEESS
jgi:uncharacterized membrane protein